MTQEPSVDTDDRADEAWLLSIQRKLYQTFPESRMHNERCMSGSARGHAKPAAARPPRRAWPTHRTGSDVGRSGAAARFCAPAPLPPRVIAARNAACAANTP